MSAPDLGRIVRYTLDGMDAMVINRRRTASESIRVLAGDQRPAIIVGLVQTERRGLLVNLRVMLDGTDDYWATMVNETEDENGKPGHWHWPKRTS